ncbi:CLIP3 [Hepatospora eriocheir]|uniref:CLIP3 n=1 Tax=Hepatospora eriocheir TaxID=1081669 RepID=A0A1X0QCT4_9MICR|nr:CLIP3 [Hepatospora eriocheir]
MGLSDEIHINDRVSIKDKYNGIVRFIGPIFGKEGIWVGILLDREVGRNDGTYNGIRYFDSPPNKGIFVKYNKIKDSLIETNSKSNVTYRNTLDSSLTVNEVLNKYSKLNETTNTNNNIQLNNKNSIDINEYSIDEELFFKKDRKNTNNEIFNRKNNESFNRKIEKHKSIGFLTKIYNFIYNFIFPTKEKNDEVFNITNELLNSYIDKDYKKFDKLLDVTLEVYKKNKIKLE